MLCIIGCLLSQCFVCFIFCTFGFMKGKGTTDAIFIVRQMQEKFRAKETKLYFGFVDLEKAFDRVPREVIRWAKCKLRVEEWLETDRKTYSSKYFTTIIHRLTCILSCLLGRSVYCSCHVSTLQSLNARTISTANKSDIASPTVYSITHRHTTLVHQSDENTLIRK